MSPTYSMAALLQALKEARARKLALARVGALRPPVSPGLGTNEAGPQVETSYPANAFPSDGDHD